MAKLLTLSQTLPSMEEGQVSTFYIVKKGKKYLTFKNNELALSLKQTEAVLFGSPKEITRFIDNAIIDDRNARVIGNSYTVSDIKIAKR